MGVNGPEITSLKKGDVIYPADETKKILNGHSPQKLYNGYAKGTGGKTFNRYENTKNTTGKVTYPSGSTSGKITYNTEGSSSSSSSSNKDNDDVVYVDVTVNVDAKLENLERKRENGEIDAFDYET